MIKIYTRLSSFKNKNGQSENPNLLQPTHYVEISTPEDYNDKVVAGDLWTKKTATGAFTSGQLKNGREYEDKEGKKVKEGEFVILNVGVEKAKKILQVYEDYLIQQRNPGYPTPTSQGIDLNKTLKPDPAFDNVPEITPEMLDINPDDIPY